MVGVPDMKRQHGSIDTRHRQDGSVAYRARKRGADGRWISKTFDTSDEAERWVLDVSLRVRNGTHAQPHQVTVTDWLDQYLDRGEHRWRGGTLTTYRQRHDAHIAPALGGLRVVDLDAVRVQRWVDGMVRRKLSPSLIHSAVHLLGGAMKEAVRLGIRDTNPCTGVALPSARTAHVGDVWSAADIGRVLAVLDGDVYWGAVYRVALATGMRPGELRALHWSDVDTQRRTIHIRRTVTKGPGGERVGETTKGGRSRQVVVPTSVIAALDAWRSEQDGAGYVFGRGGEWLKPNTWHNKHARLCAQARVPLIRVHALRHTYATLQLANGVHPKIVQEVLGHASIQQTLDTYSHLSIDLQVAAADRLDAVLGTTT